MLKIGLLYGGRSGEHDVSLCSAASVYQHLDQNKYEVIPVGIDRDGRWYLQKNPELVSDPEFGKKLVIKKEGEWLVSNYASNQKLKLYNVTGNEWIEIDLVFPVIHGTNCEDGTLQGLLELNLVPYVGAGVLGSAVGMDKDIAKRLLRDAAIPVVPWINVSSFGWKKNKAELVKQISSEIKFPLFVKPANAGSSVGVKKVKSESELAAAIEFALQYDSKVLVEKGITCLEVECAVLGNDDPAASILGAVLPRHEFYSYEAKYLDDNGAELIIPAPVDSVLESNIRKMAVEAFKVLCCSGMARVDFFVDKNDNQIYLNEINTLPGFTSISMYPKLWAKTGIDYPQLLDRLVNLAIERQHERTALTTTW